MKVDFGGQKLGARKMAFREPFAGMPGFLTGKLKDIYPDKAFSKVVAYCEGFDSSRNICKFGLLANLTMNKKNYMSV